MTPAGMALNASALTSQTREETDEERRRRLLQEQQRRLLPDPGVTSLGLSPAGYSLALGM